MQAVFMTEEEERLSNQYLSAGYLILPVENRGALDEVRQMVVQAAADYLGMQGEMDAADFLNDIHLEVKPEKLNGLRLAVIERMNAEPSLRTAYYGFVRSVLATIVGNELVMQRRVNLSIQMPADSSSLLPVHADVWSGDSPFEVVVWLPLVDCFDTKSMYLLPPGPTERLHERFHSFVGKTSDEIFSEIESEVEWLHVPYGHVVLFNQNLPHGNIVNAEKETRWSMNCRFKSLFSPYADKKLGEFFKPITMRAATRTGLNYQFPECVSDDA